MRLPRLRLRLWMLMNLVLVVALGIGGEVMRRRRNRFLDKVAYCVNMEKICEKFFQSTRHELSFAKDQQDYWQGEGRHTPDSEKGREVHESIGISLEYMTERESNAMRLFRENADYFARLRHKYERAASHPWETVSPDPPRPR